MDALFALPAVILVAICPLMMLFCVYHTVHMLRGGMGHRGHGAAPHDGAPAAETGPCALEQGVTTLRRQAGSEAAQVAAPTATGSVGHAAHTR
jgi:hypothetical protein